MEPFLVITDSLLGPGPDQQLREALSVLERGASVEFMRFKNAGELDSVLTRAATRTLVVAGNDQSLHSVLTALHRRDELHAHTLGILPLGQPNDFAASLGVPTRLTDAAAALLDGIPEPMSLLVDEAGQVAAHSIRLAASPPPEPDPGGFWSDLRARFGRLLDDSLRLRVEADGRVLHDLDEPLSALVLNVRRGAKAAELSLEFSGGNPWPRAARESRTRGLVGVRRTKVWEISVAGSQFWSRIDGLTQAVTQSRKWRVKADAYRLLQVS